MGLREVFSVGRQHTETRHGVGIDTADHKGNASAGLAATVRRPREFSVPGTLRRVLGRLGSGDAAAYDEAAREAFKAGTPTDLPPSGPSYDVAGSRGAPPPGKFAEPARRQDATTAKQPSSLGSGPTDDSLGSTGSTAHEPSMEDRLPEPHPPPGADSAEDPLRPPTNVTPVADDFFDGLIKRVEGKR